MSTAPLPMPQEGDYAWEFAAIRAETGDWTEEKYFKLTAGSSVRIEFTDGKLEFLPMPTEIHEALIQFLFFALYRHVESQKLGQVYANGIRLRIRPRKVRLPDIIFLHRDHFSARHNRAWDAADLVMEVVSDDPKDQRRDYEEKLIDYAEGGVSEYWIVDPDRQVVEIRRLVEGRYELAGSYSPATQAESLLLPGFVIDVTALFAVAKDIPE